MILSEQIKLCRKQLGMSQADLADAIWVSRNTVSNWERGDTTPDIQSLVLMSALFGLSLDEMVKGDEQVMAQALERDKNHLLIAGETFNPGNRQAADWNHTTTLSLFELRSTGGPAHGKFEDADVTDSHGLAYRLVRIATLFSRSLYHILDEHGYKVGSITRRHALQHPVFQVRMEGFDRIQLRRETRIDNGYKDVIRFDGGGVGVEGNLMGDEFSIVRNNSAIAHINARRALNRTAYGIEIVDDASAPLALGLTFAILMLRDYDRVWVRGAGRASI
ncbi:helix-turn-helix domain-containing protein [Collinsella intestinalis]|uniref:Helix-turn-helix domain-containing protein n=1 Tax=Collinsella intestinalis TaxID=147207 RepID=A0A414G056_9ACTN|nr:helix-turn-helix domain-containing protein [Collinsella intestinalis]RHD57586.1 helix-turn-helix domain-containing protein [Collinsella intestinalis]